MASNLLPQPLQMYSKIGITTSAGAPGELAEAIGIGEADTIHYTGATCRQGS
jgi:hypothetical protein